MFVRALARTLVFSLTTVGFGLIAVPPAAAEPVVLDRIIAVVNAEIILKSDLDLWMVYDEDVMLEIANLQKQRVTEEQLYRKLEELRPKALDTLIGRKLMLAQAEQFQLGATDAEVESYLHHIARNAGMPGVAELKHAVDENPRYGNWEQYRDKLREDVILYKVEHALLNVVVSDQQVLARYRELSKGEEARLEVRRLVFRAGDDPAGRDAVLKRAQTIVRRLGAGEDVDDIAEELGQEAEPQEISRSSVSRAIGERLFAANEGDVIGPLESGQGYEVFVVEDVITSDLLGFEEAKENLRRQIQDEVRNEAKDDLTEQLRGRAHIDIRL